MFRRAARKRCHRHAEEEMEYVYLHSLSCLPPADPWHVTHRMSVISLFYRLPVQSHLSRPANKRPDSFYVEPVAVSVQWQLL